MLTCFDTRHVDVYVQPLVQCVYSRPFSNRVMVSLPGIMGVHHARTCTVDMLVGAISDVKLLAEFCISEMYNLRCIPEVLLPSTHKGT